MWPIVTAVSIGGLAVGAVSKPVVFKVSVIVLLASIVEWMVQSWSERASADSVYNAGLRKRLLHPLEFPILATLGAAAFVYSFSRVMLNISKDSGRWVFMVIGAIITVAGFVFAAKRGMGKATAAGIVSLGAIALVGVGVASAISGQRTIDKHPVINAAVCLGTASPEATKEVDAKASQRVGAKNNPLANVEITKDGRLVAFPFGIGNIEYHELSVPRSLVAHVMFRNFSDTPRRLTIHMGSFKQKDGTTGAEQVDCTTTVAKGGTGFLTFRLTKSQLASSTPYALTAPGVSGEIKLLVP
jgi:hypothetical protein